MTTLSNWNHPTDEELNVVKLIRTGKYQEAKNIISSGLASPNREMGSFKNSFSRPVELILVHTLLGITNNTEMLKWLLDNGATVDTENSTISWIFSVIIKEIKEWRIDRSIEMKIQNDESVINMKEPISDETMGILITQITMLVQYGGCIPKRPNTFYSEIYVLWNHVRKLVIYKLRMVVESTSLTKGMCIIIAEYVDSYRFRRKKRIKR